MKVETLVAMLSHATSDPKLLRPMIEASAKKYADEKKITPAPCGKAMTASAQ